MIKIAIEKELLGADGPMQLEVNLQIQKGEFVAISGASGSGKTTLLRIIAGLESATGSIVVNDMHWLEKNRARKPQKRHVGFVFQDYALFENMTLIENLLFVKKDPALATRLLALSDLTQLQNRYPQTLSGGQKQRLSLCRAMMQTPEILLLDEPLSALDQQMRQKLQTDILTLHKEFGTTTIMVTHEPSEIYRLASRLIRLEQGKIIQDGAPKELLLQTTGSQKLSFIGTLLELKKVDTIVVAIVAIGQQIVEVVLSEKDAQNFTLGQSITLSTKAFAPTLH